MVTAFEGWNDAGDAASSAAQWMIVRFEAELVASIDSEEYFDFTTTRPVIRQREDGSRAIDWPDTDVWAATTGRDHDLVVVVGHEPHLRWRSWTRAVVDLATELGVSRALTMGALASDIPHTRPTTVTGTSDDPELAARLSVMHSTYEGPTGIVGVLGQALRDADLSTMSMWASVPAYVSGSPSPAAALALVERAIRFAGLPISTLDLELSTASYLSHLDELMAEDQDMAAYVADLESAADDQPSDDDLDADPGALVEEVERFLRGD